MRPSKRQSELLGRYKRHGVPTPDTERACSTLIGFLFYGEHSSRKTCSDRLDIFRKWTGATVRITRSGHPYRGHLGKVTGWRMRSRQEIAQLIQAPSRTENPFPFMAVVKLNRHARPLYLSLSDLRVINHGRQKLLFELI